MSELCRTLPPSLNRYSLIDDQLMLLKRRGLTIGNEENARKYLKFIGYYRLSGYLLPFKLNSEQFKPAASFDDVLDLYIFDRKLRLITFDAIERIEVALRATMTRTLGESHGAHWFMKPALFEHREAFERVDRDIRKTTFEASPFQRDIFIQHYYDTYSSPELPPSWMVFETLSIGAVSLTLKRLRSDLRKLVAQDFGIDELILTSWIHSLMYTRNLCAHHARLWNRVFTIKPKAIKRYKALMTPNDRFHAQAMAIEVLLRVIAPESSWSDKLASLFVEHPKVDKTQMGFPADWAGFYF